MKYTIKITNLKTKQESIVQDIWTNEALTSTSKNEFVLSYIFSQIKKDAWKSKFENGSLIIFESVEKLQKGYIYNSNITETVNLFSLSFIELSDDFSVNIEFVRPVQEQQNIKIIPCSSFKFKWGGEQKDDLFVSELKNKLSQKKFGLR